MDTPRSGYQGENRPELPFSLEAEQSVLGCILLDPDCMLTVTDYLRPESFYREVNQGIYGVMLKMFTAGETIDVLTVLQAVMAEELFPSEQEAKIYLARLAQIVPSVSNAESYARIVRDKYDLRRLTMTMQDILTTSSAGYEDAQLLLDAAEQKIYDIRQGKSIQGLRSIKEILTEEYDRLQRLSGEDREKFLGLPTGFRLLDHVLTGLNKSDLILVAGRPGMGKSAFALSVAVNVVKKSNKAVAVFTLEMSAEQVVTRLLSMEARVPSQAFRTGELSGEDWARLAGTSDRLSRTPIDLDAPSRITVAEMKARLRRVKDLGLVIIDYIGLMTTGRRNENRVQEVSEITRNLKILAKELDVPVIAASQLSRGPEGRTDHRPMLSDLRESGSIEQDADIVMFLYRESYYNPDCEEPGTAEVIVAKNRHGETTTVKVGWDGPYTLYYNYQSQN